MKNINNIKERVSMINPVKLGLIILIALLTYMGVSFFTSPKEEAVNEFSNVNQSIEKWVEENPGKIIKSVEKHMNELRRQATENKNRKAEDYIESNKSEVENSKDFPSVNKNGKITVVSFFDYNCGHCRTVASYMDKITEEFKDVTFVFRDFPILGQMSHKLGTIAMATHMKYPSKYINVHEEFMKERISSEEKIQEILAKQGIDYSNLKNYMEKNKNAIEGQLGKSMKLARDLGIRGTPAFVINGELVAGSIPYEGMRDIINKHLNK